MIPRILFTAVVTVALPAMDATATADALIAGGERWLMSRQQADGALVGVPRFRIGITALALEALAAPPRLAARGDEVHTRAAAFLIAHRQPDGGIYDPAEGYGVYGTGLGLLALAAVDIRDPALIRAGQDYLFGLQNRDPMSPAWGGIGYEADDPPGSEDLHNTAAAVLGLRATGVPAEDPRMQAALRFAMLCQDLSHPAAPVAGQPPVPARRPLANSGGGIPRPGWISPAAGSGPGGEDEPVRDPAAYGSMTYTLLTTYLALGLDPSDHRVAAARDWIARTYTVETNPGLPPANARDGLFYARATLAKAAAESGGIPAPDGGERPWAEDVIRVLAAEAQGDGDRRWWSNPARRWGEGLPDLATAYAVRALKRARAALR